MDDGRQPFGHADRRERPAYGDLRAREELRPQEEMGWCREARQARHVGGPVATVARHWRLVDQGSETSLSHGRLAQLYGERKVLSDNPFILTSFNGSSRRFGKYSKSEGIG